MNSIFTVAKYEILRYIKTKSFYITILVLSLLPLLGFFTIDNIVNISAPTNSKIGIYGLIGTINQDNAIVFETKEQGIQALISNTIGKLLVFPPDHIATGKCDVYTTINANQFSWYFTIATDVNPIAFPVIAINGGEDVAKRVSEGYAAQQIIIDGSGATLDLLQKRTAFVIGAIVALLFFLFFMTIASYITDILIKDKADKVIESILSSVSAFTFLTGRVIAACVTALLQLVAISIIIPIWLIPTAHLLFPQTGTVNPAASIGDISAIALNNLPASSSSLPNAFSNLGNTSSILVNFNFTAIPSILFFILIGLLLCVSITAFIGTVSPNNATAGRFGIVFILLTLGSVFLSIRALATPIPILNYIPIVSIPIVASLIYAGQIGFLSAAMSALVNLGFATLMYYSAVKIYSINFTMQGKSIMNFKDIIKAVRY